MPAFSRAATSRSIPSIAAAPGLWASAAASRSVRANTACLPIARDRLGLGPRLRVGAERGRVAGLGRPLLAGVVDGVQHHLLAHDLARRARRADQEVVGGRERREQFGARQRVRLRVGE